MTEQTRISASSPFPEVAPDPVSLLHDVRLRLGRVLDGKDDVVRRALATALAGGHLLLEDVPGVGKTALATALAESLGCEAARIQFTSDLLPADLTGTAIPDRVTGEFVFHPGPLFTNVVIADEINRASPRTQSALIECMAEGQVSVDGITRPLPRPFLVIATQNPADMAGTFPLPEAQRDRFTACLHLGYPQPDDEQRLVRGRRGGVRPPADPSITRTQLLALGELIAQVHISAETAAYLVGVVSATRAFPGVRLGASPRASLQLAALARAWAALDGRDAVLPDDVAGVAVMGLAHRLVMDDPDDERERAEAAIAHILAAQPVPQGAPDRRRPR